MTSTRHSTVTRTGITSAMTTIVRNVLAAPVLGFRAVGVIDSGHRPDAQTTR
jgi:hypothetical protein